MRLQEPGLIRQIVIATSGPSSSYPQRAYRNPTDELVKFLDRKHGDQWSIWEFRAEGTGYPDSEVYNRIQHFPWPDHHPPPFCLVPEIMRTMHEWLTAADARVAVVHCKAGKGRSGTIATSYLISQQGWTVEDALQRFTQRRMRAGFGNGISIPSQLRWIRYVDWWTRHGKRYQDSGAQVLELCIWGLRDGVDVTVNGYGENGKIIQTCHSFVASERSSSAPEIVEPFMMFRPQNRIVLPTADVNIDIVRRNRSNYGLNMVTSVAHVWFNVYFEYQRSSAGCLDFHIDWDAMDGIKGSARKGSRAFDRLTVKFSLNDKDALTPELQKQPALESDDTAISTREKVKSKIVPHSDSTAASEANLAAADSDSEDGVKPYGPSGEEYVAHE